MTDEGTFWLSAGAAPRQVPLTWTRRQDGGDAETAVVQAMWVGKNKSHYLTYEVADDEADAATDKLKSRTTFRIEPDAVTLMQHGAVRWTHLFREGEEYASTMFVGPMGIPIHTVTKRLAIAVHATGGHLLFDYDMMLAGEQQHVVLAIQFGAEVESDDE